MFTKLVVATAILLAPVAAESANVKLMNYKLNKYVHKTGKCGGDTETLATYYWEGQRLACGGGQFKPHGLTAAHRHLPCGTKLSVRNPHNGRQVNVTVNDRGPYTIAKLDLSLGAAHALGMNTSSYVCVSVIGGGNSKGLLAARQEK